MVRAASDRWLTILGVVAVTLGWCDIASAMDQVTLRRDGKETRIEGKILVTARDGGILLETRSGVLWTATPEELVNKTSDARPFEPLSAEELSRQFLAELPQGFDVHSTAHYLIFHNTSPAYAQWCGSLFERLYLAFNNYWSRKGFDLAKPEFPLVAVVFADQRSYGAYAKPELGDALNSIIGYFSLQSNRMVMYDLTGVEALRAGSGRAGSAGQVNRILLQPDAARLVSTIVHEATHQIAFNCGLHTRYSDCPLWFSEGVAIYFETPDLSSMRGWRNVGGINEGRLAQWRGYLPTRPADSLMTLIQDDKRFRDTSQSLNAYAEAWALTYFLMQKYPRQYVDYLRMLSKKKPLVWDTPEERVVQFQAAFGSLETVDRELLRYWAKAR